MEVNRLDHLVLTVSNIVKTVSFYEKVLGMKRIEFGEGRLALIFGNQKINLHQLGNEIEPKAGNVRLGSADLCFILNTPLDEAKAHIEDCGVKIIDGPIKRTGATGNITSLYFRDPDKNLIEVSNYN